MSYAQSLSVGVIGGIFNNGQMEDDLHTKAYSFKYTPQSPKLAVGASATLYLLRHIRLEASVVNTTVSNDVEEILYDQQTGGAQITEGKLNYGQANYQVAIAPAYRFNLGDIHPYIGAEVGAVFPAGSMDKAGWIAAGRLGLDVEVKNNVSATASVNVGQMTRVNVLNNSNSFSYYRILLGVNYTLFEL